MRQHSASILAAILIITGKLTLKSDVILGPPDSSGICRCFGAEKNFKKFQKNT
jgi:hypothetical protein